MIAKKEPNDLLEEMMTLEEIVQVYGRSMLAIGAIFLTTVVAGQTALNITDPNLTWYGGKSAVYGQDNGSYRDSIHKEQDRRQKEEYRRIEAEVNWIEELVGYTK